MRAMYQILVFPYLKKDKEYKYAIFQRADSGLWQGIAGGGQENETPLQSAKRETQEETGIAETAKYLQLSSVGQIPAKSISAFADANIDFIPEYSFGVEVLDEKLIISHEHTAYTWLNYEEAIQKLYWDSNKVALRELKNKLENSL